MAKRKKSYNKTPPKLRVVGIPSEAFTLPDKDDPDLLPKLAEHLRKHQDTFDKLKRLQEEYEARTGWPIRVRRDKH